MALGKIKRGKDNQNSTIGRYYKKTAYSSLDNLVWVSII